MKKLFALLLTLLIIISCTACDPTSQGEQETTAHTHSHTHAQESIPTGSAQEGTSTQPATNKATDPQPTEALTQQSTQADSTQPAQSNDKNLYRGTISKDTYKSPTTGLTFTKPADWNFLTDEELALKIGVDTMELADYAFPTTADRVPAVYDMWATDPDTGVNISVAYENMHVTASVQMTTDEYMEMLEGAFKNTEGTTLLGKYTVKLSGQTYQKAVFRTDTGGTSTQSTYYLRAMGKFMNIVLVSVPTGTESPNVEKMFS
ncbi:MAG: hypothetical protein IJ298_01470 [Ruminococcus sp.]|nr:hypothetical protein [Ruminococcus sp.]